MAYAAFKATVGQKLTNQGSSTGKYNSKVVTLSDPSTTSAPATATLAADIAAAVALGASPTQASVTAINSAWGTFLTAYNAYTAAVGTVVGTPDATLLVDTATITGINQLKSVLNQFLKAAEGNGSFGA